MYTVTAALLLTHLLLLSLGRCSSRLPCPYPHRRRCRLRYVGEELVDLLQSLRLVLGLHGHLQVHNTPDVNGRE